LAQCIVKALLLPGWKPTCELHLAKYYVIAFFY